MRSRLPLLAVLFACTTASAAAQPTLDCANASTTVAMTQCAALDADAAETQLNAAYKALVQDLSQPDTASENYTLKRQKLQAAQRAWIKFRDADCEAVHQVNITGTLRGLAAVGCKRQRAEQRTKELQTYLEP